MGLLEKTKNILGGVAFALALFVLVPGFVMAQEEVVDSVQGVAQAQQDEEDVLLDPNLYVGIEEAYGLNLKLRQPEVRPQELTTIFFTLWQHKLLQEAKRRFVTRPPEDYEINNDELLPENRPRGIRELSLGGIVFSKAGSWVVWLNGQRVTPDAIPKQVLDIKVRQSYIELKWIDSFTNLVYPIRLRPHQRFNLDSRIFLPGTPSL